MWIMLIKKLPTNPSPPKLSIFWSTPWPNEELMGNIYQQYLKECFVWEFKNGESPKRVPKVLYAKHLKERPLKTFTEWLLEQDENSLAYNDPFGGKTPDFANARAILYKGEQIRVFPHEFSVLKIENMRLYILGTEQGDPSHELISGSVSEQKAIDNILDVELRPMYEFALLEGANHQQAMLVTLGQNITEEEVEFEPIGWYKCIKEYAELYCYEHEMAE